ncbi:MAG TPA: DJ-1/PfpI family protein [Rudaea sp.]|nr:DJ-1/PfpI family protein [Rudaea sp.]
MKTKRVGFLVYPSIQALDLAGPMDAFAAAVIEDGVGAPVRCYETVTIGLDARTVAAESGLCIKPRFTLRNAPRLDTLVIPGGAGMRDPAVGTRVAAWIRLRARQLRRIAAVCTGVYGLAASGLLDGRRVSTHWRFAQDLAQRFPALQVDAGPLFVKDGAFYTSAGITAGIDLSLALIEEDFGPSVALSVARELVVYLKRPGGQAQFSEPLQFQTQSADRMADIASWIVANLHKDLGVEVLAARARLCPRQFTRRFKHAFGTTPAAFIESARIDEARRRLAGYHGTLDRVASSVGFRSDDVFRRTFERRLGITPSAYRTRFGARAPLLDASAPP